MKNTFNKKKFLMELIILITIIIVLIGAINIFFKNNIIIAKIKKSYINDTNISYKFINSNFIKNPKNSNEYFIRGYMEKKLGNTYVANEYFKLAFENISKKTNKFAKYYLYNIKSEELLKDNNNSSMYYAKLALNNLTIRKYNKEYKLVFETLDKYMSIKNGRFFIIYNIENVILKNKDKNIEYELKKTLALMYMLVGENDLAIQTSLDLVDMSIKLGDSYEESKAIINIVSVLKNMGAYEMAIELSEFANKINVPKDKIYERDLYSYIQLSAIYTNRKEWELLYENSQNVYDYNLLDKNGHYDDFLVYAKIDEGIWNLYNGDIEKCKLLLEEASKILKEDNEVYIHDKDIKINIAYGDLNSKIGNYSEAEKYYNVAKDFIEERGAYEYKYSIMKSLENLYKAKGDLVSYNNQVEKIAKFNAKNEKDIITSFFHTNVRNIKKMYKEELENILIILLIVIVIIITATIVFRKYKILSYESSHDGLTGIYNRRRFDNDYNKLLDKKVDFSLLIFDIDNFKNINDKFGHEFGDIVLINICKTTKKILKMETKFYRYGGEEFVVLIKNKDYKEVLNIAENIRFNIEKMTWSEDVIITISLGMANSKKFHDKTLKIADDNLYISKKLGKNRITI